MSIYKKKNSPYYYYEFTINGERRQGSTHTQDPKLAKQLEIIKRSDYIRGKELNQHKTKFDDMLKEYLEKYSKVSKKSYMSDVYASHALLKYFSGKSLANINAYEIEKYKAERLKDVSGARINRELTLLGHLFTIAALWGKWSGDNPVRKVRKFKEERKPERYLSPEERKRLFKACPKFLKPLILTALKTGMRQSEILKLKWEDIDLHRGIINVRNTKAGKLRQLPIHGELKEVLSSLPSKSRFVFSDKHGKAFTRHGLFRHAFDKAVKDAKINNFTFHDLRHTFASELVRMGVDIVTIQRYLGHSSLTVTQRYLHADQCITSSSIQKLSNENYYNDSDGDYTTTTPEIGGVLRPSGNL